MSNQIWQRILSIFLYILPFSDSLQYGKNLLGTFPALQILVIPTIPILYIKNYILFGGFVIFLALFLGIVRNPKVSYFLRFNALQAILINIAIFVAGYGIEILVKPFGNEFLILSISNSLFIVSLVITLFCSTQCLQGKEPDLPAISEAVRIQI